VEMERNNNEHHLSEQELKRAVLEDNERFASAKQGDDHETRIRDLEKKLWQMSWLPPLVGVFLTIVTGVSTWIITNGLEQVLQRLPPAAASMERKR